MPRTYLFMSLRALALLRWVPGPDWSGTWLSAAFSHLGPGGFTPNQRAQVRAGGRPRRLVNPGPVDVLEEGDARHHMASSSRDMACVA